MIRPPLSLPKDLAQLDSMARGIPAAFPPPVATLNPKQLAKWQQDLFEHAVWDAFESSGLHVRRLGHHRPGQPEPDGIAKFPGHPGFHLIIDVKLAQQGYALARPDQLALQSYIARHSQRLTSNRDERCQVIHLVIVSSTFKPGVSAALGRVRAACRTTLLRKTILLPASVLAVLAGEAMNEARLGASFFDEVFSDELTPELITAAWIERARTEAVSRMADLV